MLAIFCLFLYPHFHTRRTRIWTHKHTQMFTLGCRWIWGIFKYFTGDFTSKLTNDLGESKKSKNFKKKFFGSPPHQSGYIKNFLQLSEKKVSFQVSLTKGASGPRGPRPWRLDSLGPEATQVLYWPRLINVSNKSLKNNASNGIFAL